MRKKTRKRALITPDLTPLIDVVFLLLIFFMLVTTFDRYSGFKLELPSAEVEESTDKNIYELIIDADKKYYIKIGNKSQQIQLDELGLKLSTAKEITISADKNLKYETIVKTIGVLKKIGIDKVELNFYE